MNRIMVYSPADTPLFELDPNDVFACTSIEEVNGEHSLSITTTKQLAKGQRVLLRMPDGNWREWVVTGIDASHTSGINAIGTYYCVWSLQYDLSMTVTTAMPGTQNPVAASAALDAALQGTQRWTRGSVLRSSTGGASMYYMSGWEALGVLTEVWGGEIDAVISVDSNGVLSRSVALYETIGSQTVTRRFDYGRDVMGITRVVDDAPVACRVLPRGKGEETDTGGYGRKIDITSVNGGKNYLENTQAANLYRVPNGSGGWEYPTVIIENTDMETPTDLKAWAQEVLLDYTTPQITYTASVEQFEDANVNTSGIGLGDKIHIVDKLFGESLYLEGRVLRIENDFLNPKNTNITLGHIAPNLSNQFNVLKADVKRVKAATEIMNGGNLTTAEYLSRLLNRINQEVNGEGGYTYITEGQGIRTYDRAVTDPLVGAEATKVVEIKGGTIRIANSRTGGNWDWKTVFESGHIAAELVTAAQLTTGYIGSASGGNYWDLDAGTFRLVNTAQLGNTTVGGLVVKTEDMWYLSTSNTTQTGGSWSTTQPAITENKYIWTRKRYTLNDGTTTNGTAILATSANSAQNAVNALDNMLNQREVFNRLTNNGAAQGMVLDANGNLYINGTYIQAGTISTDIIKTTDSTTSYAKVQSAHGYSGLSLYSKTENYYDICALTAVDDTTKKASGVGFLCMAKPFINVSQYYHYTSIYAPRVGTATDTFLSANLPTTGIIISDPSKTGADITITTPRLRMSNDHGASYWDAVTQTLELQIPGATQATGGGTWYPDNPTWRTLYLKTVNGIVVGARIS